MKKYEIGKIIFNTYLQNSILVILPLLEPEDMDVKPAFYDIGASRKSDEL